MKLVSVAYGYLKQFRGLTALVLFSIIMASLFEGAGFAVLIPLIQSMTTETTGILERLPFVNAAFLSLGQAQIISLIFLFMLLLLIVKNIFLYFSNVLIAKMRFGVIRDLRAGLMNKLLRYDIKFFDSVKIGHIVNNINNETERMGNFMLAILQFLSILGRVCAYTVLLFLISWKVSSIIFILVASVLIPIERIMKKVKDISSAISHSMAEYNYKLMEILAGMRLIRVSSTENEEDKIFKSNADNVYNFMYRGNKYMHLIMPLSEVLIFILIAACFLVLINIVKIDVIKAFPFIAAYLLVFTKMFTQLNSLNERRSAALSSIAAFEHYEKMYDESGKNTVQSGDKEIRKFASAIEFKNVNFAYIPGRNVLEGINMAIFRGKITALVGASGAGKSTIVNLILRFYDVDSGKILIDGVGIKELDLAKWRRKIGFVSQDTFLFNANVRDNISYGRSDTSGEETVRAAKAANAHDFILGLPEGYDTVLGERGVKLSGGQRQRISIARAILHNPEVLILDEATSSLDTETERLITEAIDRLAKDRTVIAIAHRLSTVLHADKIIILDKGKIIESGNHNELFERNGLYRRLCDTQFNIPGEKTAGRCV